VPVVIHKETVPAWFNDMHGSVSERSVFDFLQYSTVMLTQALLAHRLAIGIIHIAGIWLWKNYKVFRQRPLFGRRVPRRNLHRSVSPWTWHK